MTNLYCLYWLLATHMTMVLASSSNSADGEDDEPLKTSGKKPSGDIDEDYGIIHVFYKDGSAHTSPSPPVPFHPHHPHAQPPPSHPLPTDLSPSAHHEGRPCTTDTGIIDKLLNGTGYNKFRIPQESGVDVAVEFW